MAVYVRMEDSKRPVKDTRSWKYYVFILVGLLILIPVAMIFYNSVLKRNKMRILSTISRAPQWTSVPKEHKTREISGSVGNNSFDFLLFTQCYPITNCITTQSSMDKCHFAPDWEAWTIHGIWPSDNGSMGPQFCKNVKFDVAVLDDIINDLDIHWYSTQPNGNENFWAHEWKKHGSCAEQLTPFNSELKYFSQGLSWNKEFNVNDMLEAHSIRPNNSRTYKTEEFENAIEAEIGVKPVLHCSSDKIPQRSMALETNELDKHFQHVEAHKKFNHEKIEAVKEWFKTQPHLPVASEKQISVFLHACYNSVELTQKTIENYYTLRTNDPDTFDGRTYETFIHVFETTYCFISPSLSLDNCNCYFFGLLDNDPRQYIILEIGRLSQTLIDLGANLYPYSNGWRLFIDASDYTLGHLLKVSMNLGYMKGYLNYVQCAMPIRLKGIHIYNSSPIIGQMIALLKPFIDRKLYEMIHTYTRSEMNSLFEFIRPEMLPVSSGGEMRPKESNKETLDNLKKYEQWFIDDERLGRVDESKRKRKPGRLGWLFGYGATAEENSQEDRENET